MGNPVLAIVLGVIAVLFARQIVMAFRAGGFVGKTGLVERAASPVHFWSGIAFGAVFFAIFSLLAIAATMAWSGG